MRLKPGLTENAGLWIGSDGFGDRLQDLARGKENVREHPARQRRPSRSDLAAYFPPETLQDRCARNEAICRAYDEGRFTQKEIGDHLGLHYVTVSCIVRAKEAERRNGTS
jgi:hypothetical protein